MSEEIYATPGKVGIEDEVIFTGRVSDPDVAALYQGALCYVQPSITEGFGLPILEAMAWGIPVVSSDGGALPEVVGEAGLVLPLGKKDGVALWVEGLSKMITQPRLRERLAAAGKWRVREFGWDKAARETLKELAR
jgi:glycosyltransferase involved in cell wall biosynthesis